MMSCGLDPYNVYHICAFNIYLIKNYNRGSVTYRYNNHRDIFMINKYGMICILPSYDSGSIAIIETDIAERAILTRIEKRMKFSHFEISSISIFYKKNPITNNEILIDFMLKLSQ